MAIVSGDDLGVPRGDRLRLERLRVSCLSSSVHWPMREAFLAIACWAKHEGDTERGVGTLALNGSRGAGSVSGMATENRSMFSFLGDLFVVLGWGVQLLLAARGGTLSMRTDGSCCDFSGGGAGTDMFRVEPDRMSLLKERDSAPLSISIRGKMVDSRTLSTFLEGIFFKDIGGGPPPVSPGPGSACARLPTSLSKAPAALAGEGFSCARWCGLH